MAVRLEVHDHDVLGLGMSVDSPDGILNAMLESALDDVDLGEFSHDLCDPFVKLNFGEISLHQARWECDTLGEVLELSSESVLAGDEALQESFNLALEGGELSSNGGVLVSEVLIHERVSGGDE